MGPNHIIPLVLAQAEAVKKLVDEASTASDRWLFLAALAIIIVGGSMVIRWLVASLAIKDKTHNDEMQGMREAHGVERAEWRTVMETSKTQFLDAIATQRKDFREELSLERHACATERAMDREARHATANSLNGVSLALQVLAKDSPEMRTAVNAMTRSKPE